MASLKAIPAAERTCDRPRELVNANESRSLVGLGGSVVGGWIRDGEGSFGRSSSTRATMRGYGAASF